MSLIRSLVAGATVAFAVSLSSGCADQPAAKVESESASPEQAAQLLEAVRARFVMKSSRVEVVDGREVRTQEQTRLLQPVALKEIVRASGRIVPVAKADAKATVALPERADESFDVADVASKMQLKVTIAGAESVAAQIADGHVVYAGALGASTALIQRPTEDGTEDFVSFDAPPKDETLRYTVELDADVKGLRLVSNVLEFLDENGAPRLRVNSPYVVDADGQKHQAQLAVEGCDVDTNPALPWGRALTPPNGKRCVVAVSWHVTKYPALVDPSWSSARSLSAVRYVHNQVTLADGRAMVLGGYPYTRTTEIYDPATDTWAIGPSTHRNRYWATATLLDDGRVLAVGGYDASYGYNSDAELYNPATNSWTLVTSATIGYRYVHTAVKLKSGKVLIMGGYQPYGSYGSTNSTVIFDPATNTFTSGPSMASSRCHHGSTLLSDGRVLVVGGYRYEYNSGYYNSYGSIVGAEIYDPATNSWQPTGNLGTSRYAHTVSLLRNGKVIAAGGYNYGYNSSGNWTGAGYLATSEVWDPATGQWTYGGALPGQIGWHVDATLGNGDVLITGGYGCQPLQSPAYNGQVVCESQTDATLYRLDNETGAWVPTMAMSTSRYHHAASRLGNGKVLVTGGYNYERANNWYGRMLNTAELFNYCEGPECTIAPVVSVPGNLAVEANGPAGSGVTFTATAIDNLDGALTPKCAPASGSQFALGSTKVTCTAKDSDGNTGSASFTVTVADTTAPTIVASANITVEASQHGGAPVTFILPTASDVADPAPKVSCDAQSGSVFPLGTNSVTCSAVDASGNNSTSSFTITVQDTTPPSISGPDGLSVDASGYAVLEAIDPLGAPVVFGVTATDIADATPWIDCAPASGAYVGVDATVAFSCTATDSAGNQAQLSFAALTIDSTPPTFISGPSFVGAQAEGPDGAAVGFATPLAVDLVDGTVPFVCVPGAGAVFPVGASAVHCTARDAHGNAITHAVTVEVVDTTAPVLQVPATARAEATSAAGAVVTFGAAADDLVDGTVQVTCAPASGSVFAIGETTVSCSASDAHGNSASATIAVTVADTTPPALSLSENVTVEATSSAGAAVAFGTSAVDVVDGAVTVSCTAQSGATFALGTTAVSCTAADARGNVASGSFTVTVADTTAPAFVAPADAVVEATSASGAVFGWVAVHATDLVDGDLVVTCNPASDSEFALGATAVSCGVSDSSGNAAAATFTVTVVDTTAPALALSPAVIAEATSAAGASVPFSAAAHDAVSGDVAVSCDRQPGSLFALGVTTVTCSASDAAGNTASGSLTVYVRDTTPPALSLSQDLIAEATSPAGAAVAYAASASDIVDGDVAVICSAPSSASFGLGTTAVTCSATDAAGNSATGSFNVTVQDTTAPVVITSANVTAEATSAVGVTVTFAPASATDLVSGALSASCSHASGAQFALGATAVTCTATDAAGNQGSASFTVMVRDTTAPTLSVPSTMSFVAASTSGQVVNYQASATDAVAGSIQPTCSPASGSLFAPGTTQVMCTATDGAGNRAQASFDVVVAYAWTDVLAPIDHAGTSVFKLGRTVPVKFKLSGASASITNLCARLYLARLTENVAGDEVEAVATTGEDSGNVFRYDAAEGQYIFNLSTRALSQGTYLMRIDLGDGVVHLVTVAFRK